MMRDANSSNRIICFEPTRSCFTKQGETALPDPEEATSFWKKIWSEEVSHNEKASWLEDVELEFSTTEKQADINITAGDIRSGVSKMANWKAAGPELVQGFWFKKLTGLHPRLQESNACKTVYVKQMYQSGWSGEEQF